MHYVLSPDEYDECICSVQSENLRNLEIALRILRILRLHNYHTCATSKSCNLHAQSTNFHLASPPETERLLWICNSQDGRQP